MKTHLPVFRTSRRSAALIIAAAVAGHCGPVAAAVPAIFSLAPAAAVPGAPVVIAGTNFNSMAATNVVYFGAVQANVVAATPTSLTATVPPGATFGPVTVTVGGLTAYSGQFFEPTFAGSNTAITAGSFAPSFDVGTATNPGCCILADLDGDGKPDIVVACGGSSVLSIYRNISASGALLGAASFAPPVNLTFPTNGTGGNPYRVRAVDLDGDGKLDLIVAEVGGNRVSVFHNVSTPGNLAFEPAFALIVGNDCRSVAAGDLDGDGRPDIVALNYGDKTISLLRNLVTAPGILNAGSFAAPAWPLFSIAGNKTARESGNRSLDSWLGLHRANQKGRVACSGNGFMETVRWDGK